LTVFVDTSALYGLIDADDPAHARLAAELDGLESASLLTHNYVVVESAALVGQRLGSGFVHRLLLEALAAIELVWVDETVHRRATSAYLSSTARRPSLVDFTSFEVMRLHGIRTAFAVDRDFAAAGFEVIPSL
jgi:uncharacterized protein